MDLGGLMIVLVVILAVVVVVFLVLRELVLWYLRINERVELLQSIDRRLAVLSGTEPDRATEAADRRFRDCPKCGAVNHRAATACRFCKGPLDPLPEPPGMSKEDFEKEAEAAKERAQQYRGRRF